MSGASISSLLSAPVSFYTPDVLAGAPVAEGTRFELHESEGAAIASADGPHLTYLTYFPGPISGIGAGTPVRMKGMQVGRVRDVRLRYVPESASLETPVTLEIDPRELELHVPNPITREQLRRSMNDALSRMVQRGMRATLATSLILPGASGVSLEFVAQPGTGRLNVASDPPVIPAATSGSGVEGALAALNDVAGTIRNLPLREIAADMRSAARRVNELVSDPALDESMQRLNRSLTEIERAANITSENIGPITESLRNAASAAESAATRVEQLVGTSQRQGYDVGELVRELTRAAEAVRALASYLTENPDSLLKGRRE